MNFCHLSVPTGDLSTNSVQFLCGRENFGPISVESEAICQLFMWPRDPLSSLKFPCSCETFHQLRSTFSAVGRPFVKLHQLSVWPDDLSTSVNLRAAENLL